MNAGVALVQACLQINGYFTSADSPVIQGRRGGGDAHRDDFMEVTDIDILAVRLPLAAHVFARGRRGPEDDLELVTDPVLDPSRTAADVVVHPAPPRAVSRAASPRRSAGPRPVAAASPAKARVRDRTRHRRGWAPGFPDRDRRVTACGGTSSAVRGY